MHSDTENYLEFTGNIICWLIACIFIGYLSAQILAWFGRGPQFARIHRPVSDMQCIVGEEFDVDTELADSEEPIEFGVFRDMRWQVVKI